MSQAASNLVELQLAVASFLAGRLRYFNDSRTVDDDLVALAKALHDSSQNNAD